MRGVLVAILLAGSSCSLFGPTVVCDEGNLGGEMTCAEVLSAARTQLAAVTGISTLTAVQGGPCRTDSLSCGPDIPDDAPVSTVYADLSDGRQLAVRVFVADGSLRADPQIDMETMR